jgi:hypothetical protein
MLQYTMDTAYAFSDGLWHSYTRSHRFPVEVFPPFLSEWQKLPAPVAAYAQKNPSAQLLGFSVIRGTPKELDAKKEPFSKTPASAPASTP